MYQGFDRTVRIDATGPFKLTDARGADLTPRGRKARALILYLLRSPGHVETRKNLTALLWSDRGVEQARQSLRQTLYELRHLMDEAHPVIVADRFSVRLDPAYLSTGTGDPLVQPAPAMAAAELDGISPAFDRWLHQERRGSDAPSAADGADAVASRSPAAPLSQGVADRHRRWRRHSLLVASLLGLASIATLYARSRDGGERHRVIVVEPLQVAHDDPPAGRLSLDFIGDLSRAVLGHDATLEFADAQSTRQPTATFKLGGKVATVGKDLHAIVTVSDGDDPGILWSHDYTAPLDDLSGLRQQVSTNVAAVLVCALGAQGMPDRIDTKALALYLEACNLHSGDQRQAADLLRLVTQRAPRFAGGWADLATSLAFASQDTTGGDAEAMGKEAEAAARRALALNPHMGNAYYARALLRPGIRDWVARERIVRAGLAAQPDNPQLYNLLAIDLAAIGRQQDNIAANRRAVALDPLFPGKTARLIRALANAGELEEADDAVRHMRETWPDNGYTWHARFETAARIGDAREAEAMLDDPNDVPFSRSERAAWKVFLQARASPTRRNVDSAIAALLAERHRGGATDAQLVSDLTLLGHPREALDIALRMPAQTESDFWFRSVLGPLHADPRFMTVAQRQGLVQVWRATGLWPDFCGDRSLPYDCRKVASTLRQLPS